MNSNPDPDFRADFLKAADQFFHAETQAQAFHKLDRLCEMIISDPGAAIGLKPELNVPALQARTSEIDAIEEKQAAQRLLTTLSASSDPVSEYDWSLEDYYDREWQFIKNNLKGPVDRIQIVGQGAVPSLALAIRRADPDIKFDFYDIDPEALALASKILGADITAPDRARSDTGKDTFALSDIATERFENKPSDLLVLTNAPVQALRKRQMDLTHNQIFIRSATAAGEILYPGLQTQETCLSDYQSVREEDDPLYGIHKLHMLER